MTKQYTPLEELNRIRKWLCGSAVYFEYELNIIETTLKDYQEITDTGWKNIASNLKMLTKILDKYLHNSNSLNDLETALKRLEEIDTKIIPNMKEHYDMCNEERLILRNQIETTLKDYITRKQESIAYLRVLEKRDEIWEKHNIKDIDELDKKLCDYERLLNFRKSSEWADEKLQTKKKLQALEIIKEYLTIDEKERKLCFKDNLTGIIFPELKMLGGNPHYELLKEVLL